jgi:GTP-binding protein LepA
MILHFEGTDFILNFVATPGHVDFFMRFRAAWRPSRELFAGVCHARRAGANFGNLELAKKQNLVIIPVINKIDSPIAKTDECTEELSGLLNVMPEDILKISAKDGTNVEQVLETIIKKIPAPQQSQENDFRALIFDSEYDPFKGVIAYVRAVDGEILQGEKIELMAAKAAAEIKEAWIFKSHIFAAQPKLMAGDIGYIATGIKSRAKCVRVIRLLRQQTTCHKGCCPAIARICKSQGDGFWQVCIPRIG